MVDRRFRPCPTCGGSNLDIDSTPAAEIAGVSFQTCWVECENCWYYFDFEYEEGVPDKSWDAFIAAWNELGQQ